MKKCSRFLAMLLAMMMLIVPISAAFAEALQLSDLTAADYYAMHAAAEGNWWDDNLWNPIINDNVQNSGSLSDLNQTLEDQNDHWLYNGVVGKTVDKNYYPVISDDERAAVDAKIANLYADEVANSGTLREAYEAQNKTDTAAGLLGGETDKDTVKSNIESQITEEQQTALDSQFNALVEKFVKDELANASSLDDFANLISFMTDDQKLDFLTRLTEEDYKLIQDFVDNYLWPTQEFTFADDQKIMNGLYVNGELISGSALLNYLFSLSGYAFKAAVNQMDIKQAGSLEALVSDAQADQILQAWRHAGFKVSAPSINGGSAVSLQSARGVQLTAENAADPVWPAEGSIKLDKDAKAVEGAENLWEVTLGIQGKNYKTTSDVVLVIDCSGSMEDYNKMTNTRKAAKAFGEKLLTAGGTTRIAIVTFIDKASAYNNGHFYTADELDAFKTAVDRATYTDGGTNQQAGIHVAQQLLQSAASTGKLKNIVILSDGEATYSHPFTGGNATIDCGQFLFHWFEGNPQVTSWPANAVPDYTSVIGTGNSFDLDGNIQWNCRCEHNRTTEELYGSFYYDNNGNFVCSNGNRSSNNGVATIWEANQAKNAGTTIYSIALSAGTNGENTLKACATNSGNDYFAIASSDNVEQKLTAAFEKIAGSIAIAAKGGIVLDTMGNKVQLSFSGAAPRITTDKAEYDAGRADVYISQGTATYDAANRKIDWTVGNVSEGDVPTMKYKVTIRDGVSPASGETLLTNEGATFKYKDYQDEEKEKEFPKPEVTVGGGKILVHYYLVNDNGEPINENGVVVDRKDLAYQVKTAEYHAVDGNTGLSYNTLYTVPYEQLADYEYYGSYNLNDGDLTVGDSVNVTLTAANSNQHVWFAYKEKPKTGNLTITKTGCSDLDPNQSFVFTVSGGGLNGQTIEVVIHGNSFVTIKDLPAGSYTVTENTDWSWRYTPASNNPQTTTVKGGATETVTFTNSRDKVKWLDGNTYCDNRWSTKTSIKPGN